MLKNVIDWVETSGINMVHISQNDNQRYCKCDACQADIDYYGSPAGSVIKLLNRIDEVIVFRPLTPPQVEQIAGRMVDLLVHRVANLGYRLEVHPGVVARLAQVGFDPVYGARPLRRAIQSQLEDPLAQRLLTGLEKGEALQVSLSGDTVVLE